MATTIEGGHYIVDGQPVDANGKPVKKPTKEAAKEAAKETDTAEKSTGKKA